MVSLETAFPRAADSIPPVRLFAVPSVPLRETKKTPETPEKPEVGAREMPASFSTSASSSKIDTPIELHIQRYEAMNGTPFLLRPISQVERGGFAGFLETKIFDPIVTPGVLKFHNFSLAGGVVGTFQSGNPLCLLNPLVFAIDW
jgi:hypothetical protein